MGNLSSKKKIGFALFIIIIGALFLIDNLGLVYLRIPYYFTQWYTFLLILGLFLLFVRDKAGPGITLVVIGGLFMIDDIFYVSIWNLWPLLLIGAGVAILIRRNTDQHVPDIKNESPNDVIDEVTIFSGSERVITSTNFRGGKLSTVFGGAEIDLSHARLAPGTNVIDIFTMFGGSTIYVPSDMNVQVKVTSIFGGYSDERNFTNPGNEEEILVITGTVLFGGGEVKTKHIART